MKKIFKADYFTQSIADYRQRKVKLSMDDASREIGISKSTLSRIEKGNNVDIETFALCCKWMGLPVNEFFKYD